MEGRTIAESIVEEITTGGKSESDEEGREEMSAEAIEIKDWYEHEHSPSVFLIFRKDASIVWSFSGNNLRSQLLAEPDEFISGPIECQIPQAVYDQLSHDLEDF